MKKVLVVCLVLLMVFCLSVPEIQVDAATSYPLFIYVNEGVEYVKVRINYGEIVTYTSSSTIGVEQGKYYQWEAKAKTGYTLDKTSGSGTVNYPTTLSPKATAKSFTVTASWTPAAEDPDLTWTLTWASGKALTGAVTDYVTMTVSADKKSVTLTFKKAFTNGQMILTCYATNNPSVKATCTVTCS